MNPPPSAWDLLNLSRREQNTLGGGNSMSLRTGYAEVTGVEDGSLLKGPAERRLGPLLLRLAMDCSTNTVSLDCAGVASVNGRELGALVTLYKRLKEEGRRLVLCNVSALLYEVFQVTRLCTLFEVRQAALPCQPARGASSSPHPPYPALAV
jgi:anti-anti-sigma factor